MEPAVVFDVRVDPEIFETYPGYAVLVVYASALTNRDSSDESIALLREAEAQAREAFGEKKPASHPHIAAWREAYRTFGSKPSKFLCSVEALMSRTLKGNDLPPINEVVDLYNAVSIRHVLPIGGEDRDTLTSDLVLKFADGSEPFDAMSSGEIETVTVDPGEVVFADSTGVTCRRWNWRQCARTQLTTSTTNAYFILDSLPPFSLEQLQAAGDDLVAGLRRFSPDCRIEQFVISAPDAAG
jgi:DNA/RNA-binding domain of Phe-tRNA-synthetase-like protein